PPTVTPPVANPGKAPITPPPSTLPQTSLPAPDDETQNKLSRWLIRQAERLQKMDGSLSNSPALQQAVRDLARYTAERGRSQPSGNGSALEGQLRRLNDYVKSQDLFAARNWPALRNFSWPKITLPDLPSVNRPQGVPFNVTLPRAAPGPEAGGG